MKVTIALIALLLISICCYSQISPYLIELYLDPVWDASIGNVGEFNQLYLSNISGSEELDYRSSIDLGKEHATAEHSDYLWLAGGFASGMAMHIFGAGFMFAMAEGKEPHNIPENCNVYGYRRGYRNRSRTLNRKKALIGALVGTLGYIILM